jgi:hypothetical protein
MSREEEPDELLREILRRWQVPPPSASLDVRITDSFRRRVIEVPRWKRLLATRLAVPAPVALAFVAAFLCLSAFSLSQMTFWPRAKRSLPEDHTQRPIPREATSPMMAPNDSSGRGPGEMDSALIRTRSVSSYITRLDLDGFQPLPRGTIKVERMDEKK